MDEDHFIKEEVCGELQEAVVDERKLPLSTTIKVESEAVDFTSHHKDSDEEEMAVEEPCDEFDQNSPGSSGDLLSDHTNSECHKSSLIPRILLIRIDSSSPSQEQQPNKKISFNSRRDLKKWCRNTRQRYTSRTGKIVAPRQRRRPHVCKRNKCHKVITDEVGDAIFAEYWTLASRDRRMEFIAKCLESLVIKKRRHRPLGKGKKPHPKSVTYSYHFDYHGERLRVCKSTFLRTLGETDGFLRRTAKTKSESSQGALMNDKRGRHTPAAEPCDESDQNSSDSSDDLRSDHTNSEGRNSSVIPRIPLIGIDSFSPSQEQEPHEKIRSNSRKELNKWRRNTGQMYTSRTGKIVAPRQRRRPHVCKLNKCHEVITDEVGDAIFAEYWTLASRDRRVEFVAKCLESLVIKKRRHRPLGKGKTPHPKSVTYSYHFDYYGERLRVCKSTFLGTLGETDGFLRRTAKTKSESSQGALVNDKRGRHTPVHKLKDDAKQTIYDFILGFVSYPSDCSCAKADNQVLSSSLSISKLLSQFLENPQNPQVSYSTFQRIFHTTGLKFGQPCTSCDTRT